MRQGAFQTRCSTIPQRCSTVATLFRTCSRPYTEVVQLRTLGGLKLEGAVFSQPRPLLMLTYLALEGPQERRHLAELFWPASSQPLTNLRPVLTRLKKISAELVEGDSVRVWTTIDNDAKTLLEALEKHQPIGSLEAYVGPFLEGVSLGSGGSELEEWVLQTREFIAGHVQEALLSLAEVEASGGDFQQAGKQAERAYLLAGAGALEPHDLHRVHTLLLAGGNLRAEEVGREALDFDHSLVASQVEARDRLRSRQQEDERPGLSNLPNLRTSFLGRELELSEVSELLVHPDCPLLSLVGTGGVGKTRLALQAAQELLTEGTFADGVVFVPLEALTDATSIPAVVAGALELTLRGEEDARSVVERFLEERRLLLVLDNFEHLLEGASFVRQLIDNCPTLKLLVTSRERLNLEHEWVLPVEGLTYPEEGTTIEQGESFDAVRLFFQRARRAQPTFSLTPKTLPAVSKICQLVGGMPLAIELASSWLRALPVSEIAGELEVGLDLLESSARDVRERQRGVRVVFDHSWSLLSEGERRVLRRLSVFRGGFTRKAASEIANVTLAWFGELGG